MKKFFTYVAMALMSAGAFSANAEEITVYIEDYDGKAVADPFVTDIVANEDGSFTIADIMNSGEPFSFTFDVPAAGDWSDDIKITSPVDASATYPYLLSADGEDYLYCNVYGYDGVEGATAFNFPYVAPTYSFVYRYATNGSDDEYEYYATICACAFLENDSSTDWFYLDFYFGKQGSESAVKAISTDENAPVEFYNLNGMRVENPSNGIYIRKQGNSVKKITVK